MQSSYRVIKESSVVKEGAKEIVTKFKNKIDLQQKELGETNAKIFIDSYENLAKTIMENAQKQKDEILYSAYGDAEIIKNEAYSKAQEKGYKEGFEQGQNDGFKKAYEDNVGKALEEAKTIKNNADNILKICVEEKERYIRENEEEVKGLIINCVENILKTEVKNKEGMNSLIFQALSQFKNTEAFIIKSKKMYCNEFKEQIDLWKEQLPFKGDIFVVPDESIEEGKAIIQRDNGKTVVGIDVAMEKVREIIYGVE